MTVDLEPDPGYFDPNRLRPLHLVQIDDLTTLQRRQMHRPPEDEHQTLHRPARLVLQLARAEQDLIQGDHTPPQPVTPLARAEENPRPPERTVARKHSTRGSPKPELSLPHSIRDARRSRSKTPPTFLTVPYLRVPRSTFTLMSFPVSNHEHSILTSDTQRMTSIMSKQVAKMHCSRCFLQP